ncbi:MAG: CARDB domain-containing protein [candidate division WOR-3 bacterium]
MRNTKIIRILNLVFIFNSVVWAKVTFFTEDFNSVWTSTNPPSEWRIINDSLGSRTWDRDSAGFYWQDNHSGYAQIAHASERRFQHQDSDSLISPVINCYRYRNIVLRCSTFFQHIQAPYSAKIVGSIDGGRTYPYLIRNYFGESFSTVQLESINLDWAWEQESVCLAWVFAGNLTNINFWCLDDVSLTGDSVYDNDIACTEILQPFEIQPPIDCTVKVRIANVGKNDLANIYINCKIYGASGDSVHFASAYIDNLEANNTLEVNLAPPWTVPDIPTTYLVKAWSIVSGDENPTNDTINKNITIGSVQELSYFSGVPAAGENFPIGNQGFGVKFTPSFYPAIISQVDCYLYSNLPMVNYRYKIRVVDDDGVNSTPGTTLFETPVVSGHPEWNFVYINPDTIFITQGSVYIFYMQVDDVPFAPFLYHDGSRTDSVQYYKYVDSTYIPDYPDGDWCLKLKVEYLNLIRRNNDVRTVYISLPNDIFLRRPFEYTTKVKAWVENIGLNDQINFAVSCTVKSYFGGWQRYFDVETIPSLAAGQGTFVEFSPPWQVRYDELREITVNTHLPGDQNLHNNKKSKLCFNTTGMFSKYDSISNYAWVDSDSGGVAYNWIEPIDANLAIDCGDDTIVPLPQLLFPFPFFDSVYNYIYVSTNGFISFSNSPSSPFNCSIPNSQLPNCAVYVFWDDLVLPIDQTAKIYYQIIGSAPNRKLVITWYNIARKGTDYSNRLNFQIILCENGDIICQYQDVLCGAQWADYGKDATVGIENQDGTQGLLYLFGSDTAVVYWPENRLSNQRAIKFYKQYVDIAPIAILTPQDSLVPSSIQPQVQIKNLGASLAEQISVYFHMSPDYSDSATIQSLQPNEVQIVSFRPIYRSTGKYYVVCSTKCYQDQNYTNNILQDSFLVLTWVLKAPIPSGEEISKVKNGALTYDQMFNKIFALKGGNRNDFWCYDIATNTWESLPRMPRLPSNKKPKAGCALTYKEGKIYALKGGNTRDFYEYTPKDLNPSLPDSLRWKNLSPIQDTLYTRKKPKDGAALVFCPLNGLIYAILGNNTNVLLAYNPQNNHWYHQTQFEGKKMGKGASMTYYDGKLYIFPGKGSRELLQYDITQGQVIVCSIPGGKNKVKGGGASTCQSGLGTIYFFIGGNTQKFFRYNINNSTFDSLTPIPLGPHPQTGRPKTKVKDGAALVATPSDLVYAFKGGGTYEFWAYSYLGDLGDKCIITSNSDTIINSENVATENLVFKRNLYCLNYSLNQTSNVKLELYSITGQYVKTLINQEQLAGRYTLEIPLDRLKISNGIYFIKGYIGYNKVSHKIVKLR